MLIPSDFTPIQKCIVRAYIEYRSAPLAAVATFHDRNSSFVREVIRKYKNFLIQEDSRLRTAAQPVMMEPSSVMVVTLCSFPSSDSSEAACSS